MWIALAAAALAESPAPSPAALLDLVEGTTRKSCVAPVASSSGKPHPGAEQIYAGSLRIHPDGRVEGVSRRHLWANETWKQLPGLREGKDCVDVWTVTGTRATSATCKDCAFELRLEGHIDRTATTCERRLNPETNHIQTSYGVKQAADGSLELVFASGKPFATGKRTGDVIGWASPATCIWF